MSKPASFTEALAHLRERAIREQKPIVMYEVLENGITKLYFRKANEPKPANSRVVAKFNPDGTEFGETE